MIETNGKHKRKPVLMFSHIRDIVPNMESLAINSLDQRIAARLRELRASQGWSLDELSKRSAVSRATLSRLENAEVSPTAAILGRICGAYGLTMSRLMYMAEDKFTPLIRHEQQPVWTDAETGFRRHAVSPPDQALAGEVLRCELAAATTIDYELPPKAGLEHHLVMTQGELRITVDGETHMLKQGDCLRYRLIGPSKFETSKHVGAQYFLFLCECA